MFRRIDPVRIPAFAGLVLLGGCSDPVRVESFVADPSGTFVYAAQTNTVMTPNEDGEAEQIRFDWLAQELSDHGMCGAGYVIEIRRLLDAPDTPPGNAHEVVYTGRCL